MQTYQQTYDRLTGLGSNQGDPIAMIIAIQVLLNRLKGMVNVPPNLSTHLFWSDDSELLVSQQYIETHRVGVTLGPSHLDTSARDFVSTSISTYSFSSFFSPQFVMTIPN